MGGKGLLPKICHTYLTMIKLITHIYSYALGKGNLIFYCMDSCENYLRSVVRQNDNNNPQVILTIEIKKLVLKKATISFFVQRCQVHSSILLQPKRKRSY